MSILKKSYEISVWEDVWDSEKGKFVEQRIATISSNSEKELQSRVFSPNLTRNANGTKKLTFKLYKQYRDNVTGELVHNSYYDLLINERKVKLRYDGKWYDFAVKNIQENSSTHLCTYQLEDAIVQELSKNGFNVTLDDDLMNNSGTANELAAKVLEGTDWTISPNSEAFVEGIEEAIVYLTTNRNIEAYHILDQKADDLSKGVQVEKDDSGEYKKTIIPSGSLVLGFYSSCSNQPYRFQFIYISGLKKDYGNNSYVLNTTAISKDDNRFITNKDCQYFIDNPKYAKYTKNGYDFYLPEDEQGNWFNTTTVIETEGFSSVTLSSEYRARRYGYQQKSCFSSSLNRYLNEYRSKGAHPKTYFGYLNTEYYSPALIQNIISNTTFKSTSGWVGNKTAGTKTATVENVVGRFDGNGDFVGLIDEFNFEKEYSPYMKLTFPQYQALVLNTGPHDHRLNIKTMLPGEEWVLICSTEGSNEFFPSNFVLGEYIYTGSGYEFSNNNIEITSEITDNSKSKEHIIFFKVEKNTYSEDEFKKKSQVRLGITNVANGEPYYIKNISLFKVIRDGDGNLVYPEGQAENISQNVIKNAYRLHEATKISEVDPNRYVSYESVDYDNYAPVMNEGAQKVRSISIKESNYFNILQTIAETFEAWLDFEIVRDNNGSIIEKKVLLRNYIGKENHVGFKHGVNLKGIQRTFESKQLVTKLIVKDNKNEFAKNGFCSISRASANSLGENYIYDFQYYFNKGLMNARDYLDVLYTYDKARGPDIESGKTYNLYGYFPRIKVLNQEYDKLSSLMLNLSKDIVQLQAKFEVASAAAEAALSGMEESETEFQKKAITNLPIKDAVKEIDYSEQEEIAKTLVKYYEFDLEYKKNSAESTRLDNALKTIKSDYASLKTRADALLDHKAELNRLFFSHYSRFIQEGTWVDESYVDDEKYFSDAQSVLYNSCYPKAAYNIDVIEISMLPGYEDFTYDLGDKTYVEDKEFFGSGIRAEVVVTETVDDLDDPTKSKIKIQTFKNQFQDLFQKITATVQQTKYSTGSYEKAVALAEAGQERRNQFVTDALSAAETRLMVAGQQSVTIGEDGITITDVDTPCDSIRMVGGAILLSKQDKNGQQKWVTGVTSDGVSASLITAGVMNTGVITIMDYDTPTFRWDSCGLTAFDAQWSNESGVLVISKVDTSKFIRFDKNGIYGIDNSGVDGINWKPSSINDIHNLCTFALTWEGLRVTTDTGFAHIGLDKKNNNNIIRVVNKDKVETFCVDSNGNVTIKGEIIADGGSIGSLDINENSLYGTYYIAANPDAPNTKVARYTGIRFDNSSDNNIAFFAGSPKTVGTDAPFYVTNNGYLHATGAYIQGEIHATDGSFTGIVNAEEGKIGKGDSSWIINNYGITAGKTSSETLVGMMANGRKVKDAGGEYRGYIKFFAGGKVNMEYFEQNPMAAADLANFVVTDEGYVYIGGFSEFGGGCTFRGDVDGQNVTGTNMACVGTLSTSQVKATGWIKSSTGVNTPEIQLQSTEGTTILKPAKYYAQEGGTKTITVSADYERKSLSTTHDRLNVTVTLSGSLDRDVEILVTINGISKVRTWVTIEKGKTVGTASPTTPKSNVLLVGAVDCEPSFFEEKVNAVAYSGLYCSAPRLIIPGVFEFLHEENSCLKLTHPQEPNTAGTDVFLQFWYDPAQSAANVEDKTCLCASFFHKRDSAGNKEFWLYSWKEPLVFGNDVGGTNRLEGTWSGTVIPGSDKRLKTDIETLSEQLDIMYDKLIPRKYRYLNPDDGNTGYHFGFIAQNAQEALLESGMEPKWAGVVKNNDTGMMMLNYNEFITLNTWQIQKLKPRMTAAEQEIEYLKFEVERLNNELENLKKS